MIHVILRDKGYRPEEFDNFMEFHFRNFTEVEHFYSLILNREVKPFELLISPVIDEVTNGRQ